MQAYGFRHGGYDMYAEIIESDDRVLAIRTQPFRIKKLAVIICTFATLSIIALVIVIMMGNVGVLMATSLLLMAFLLLFFGLRQMSLDRKGRPIFSRGIVFDKVRKRIEIKGKGEGILNFSDIEEIRYEHTRHFGSSGGSHRCLKVTHEYSLALRASDGTYVYVASGREAISSQLRNEISKALGKPITYLGSAGHLEGGQDETFRAVQEKLSKKRD
jgi:hypothetical protein